MTAWAKRVDANHGYIRDNLRKIPGCVVEDTSRFGRGWPDLIVGYKDRVWFFEIKDGDKPPSARKLTPPELEFQARWGHCYRVILTLDDALREMGILKEE